MSLPDQILTCLRDAGFDTGTTPLLPLGQPLPLVSGWAISNDTGSLALLAEAEQEWDEEPWRELFFAVASLRHELRQGRGSAFGTPAVLAALRDESDALQLRALAEQLSREYLLFTRLELNVIVESGELDLELALAPLLPRTRRAIREGAVVGAEALARLGGELREQIVAAADALEDVQLRPLARTVAQEVGDQVASLVEVDISSQPRPEPPKRITLRNFRAFGEADFNFSPFTLLEGLNGTGKSSLIEALEIAWTGSSPRRPAGVTAKEFDRHLKRDGLEPWTITAWAHGADKPNEIAATVADVPRLGVGRTVFASDAAHDIAGEAPVQRYAEFLRVVGLDVPELPKAADELRQAAKRELNAALEHFGIAPVARVNTPAASYVRQQLEKPIRLDRSAWEAAEAAAEAARTAAQEHGLVFRLPIEFTGADDARLSDLDKLGREAAPTFSSSTEYARLARVVSRDFGDWAKQSEAYALTLDQLLAAATPSIVRSTFPEPPAQDEAAPGAAGLPARPAASWLFAARTLRQAVQELEQQQSAVSDREWTARLEAFLSHARAALEATPFEQLEAAQRRVPETGASAGGARRISSDLLWAAGFQEPMELSELPESLVAALRVLRQSVRSLAETERNAERAIHAMPLLRIEGEEQRLQMALARFELVRHIQQPLERAQERVLDALFGETLRGVLVELIMALTRFEWYFRPPIITVRSKAVEVSGMATGEADLDVRMLLNAGERSIVTLAWFLALHVLQPDTARKTLVLDDPFSHLDSTNQAAAIATIRSLLRLTRPELFIFSCHDPALADAASSEFARFNGWPNQRIRYQFARSSDGTATAKVADELEPSADLAVELARIKPEGTAVS